MNQSLDRCAANPAAPSAVAPASAAKLDDPNVIAAVQEYLAGLEAGRKPDRPEFLARYPAIAGALAGVLDALEVMHSAAACQALPLAQLCEPAVADVQAGKPLGDFRIPQEIGRGGMGIVYEAEQLSLGRRVALKVLPFASTLDAKQLQRFKNEAQAAAHLHHQSIVPVYATGSERGVHYYAMQFIDGQSLAAVIRGLRQLSGLDGEDEALAEPAIQARPPSALVSEFACGRWPPLRPTPADPQPAELSSTRATRLSPLARETPTVATLSTGPSTTTPAYFAAVARLGVQAAEALDHAHELGVVHRDIKPANLLVDGRGRLWPHRLRSGALPEPGRINDDRRPGRHAPLHEPGTGAGPARRDGSKCRGFYSMANSRSRNKLWDFGTAYSQANGSFQHLKSLIPILAGQAGCGVWRANSCVGLSCESESF